MNDCALIFSKRIDDGFGLRGGSKILRRITDVTKHYRKQTLGSVHEISVRMGGKVMEAWDEQSPSTQSHQRKDLERLGAVGRSGQTFHGGSARGFE